MLVWGTAAALVEWPPFRCVAGMFSSKAEAVYDKRDSAVTKFVRLAAHGCPAGTVLGFTGRANT